MSFGDDVEKWANETAIEQTTKIYRAGALEMFGAIITETPVGDPDLWTSVNSKGEKIPPPPGYTGGTLRASWFATLNRSSSKKPDEASESASTTTQRAESTVKRAELTDDIYLTNNQPYAGRVELGWSTQAPAGMVGVNVARFPRLIKKAAREFNK